MDSLIFVVLDGLNAKTAFAHLGFMESLVEKGRASVYTVKSELPAMSRPLYEVLQTGVPAFENGIRTNLCNRRTNEVSLFRLVQENGGTTAAAAYYWVSELYNKTPFDKAKERFQFGSSGEIEHGIYYWADDYPDTHLFADAEYLIETFSPDYLLVHPMNIDHLGHSGGSETIGYKKQAMMADVILAQVVPEWRSRGYQVVVTADHGMNAFGFHNGTEDSDRLVPLYLVSDKVKAGDFRETVVPQLEIAPTIASLLGIGASEKMVDPVTVQKEDCDER